MDGCASSTAAGGVPALLPGVHLSVPAPGMVGRHGLQAPVGDSKAGRGIVTGILSSPKLGPQEDTACTLWVLIS